MGRRPKDAVGVRGAIILEFMKLKRWKSADLARASGQHPQTIRKIISGEIKHPSIDKMEKIADALDVPLDLLRPDNKGVAQIWKHYGVRSKTSPGDGHYRGNKVA